MSACAIAGGFWLWVGVDVGAVVTGFEQREAQCILASQKGSAGEAAAVTDDPITPPVTFDVEVIGWTDTCRDKIVHGDSQSLFYDPQQKVLIL